MKSSTINNSDLFRPKVLNRYLDAFSYCGHVRVMWINDTSAFVAIEEKQFLPEVKQVIANNKDISVQDRI